MTAASLMINRPLQTLLMLMFMWASGCTSTPSIPYEYAAGPTPVPIPEAMPARNTGNGLTVGADPFVQRDRQDHVFAANFHDLGILPLLVYVKNHGSQPLLIRYSDMALELAAGRQIKSMGAFAVLSRLEQVLTYERQSGLVPVPPSAPVVAAPVAVAGGMAHAVEVHEAIDHTRAARKADYQHKQFHEVALAPEESAYGFVYFIPSVGTPGFSEATLIVRGLNAEQATSSIVRVPLDKLDFIESPFLK